VRACARSGCVCVRGNSASSKRVRSQGGVRFTGRTYRQKWVDSRGGGRKKSKRATAGGRRGAGTGEGRPGRGRASRGRRCWQSPVSGTQQDMRTCKRSTRKTHSSAGPCALRAPSCGAIVFVRIRAQRHAGGSRMCMLFTDTRPSKDGSACSRYRGRGTGGEGGDEWA